MNKRIIPKFNESALVSDGDMTNDFGKLMRSSDRSDWEMATQIIKSGKIVNLSDKQLSWFKYCNDTINGGSKLTVQSMGLIIKIMSRIESFHVVDDQYVSSDGDVDLQNMGLTAIPFRFKFVKRHFDISNNKLTSLYGSPEVVGGSFNCYKNNIKQLSGGPRIVNGSFHCLDNDLTSLIGGPIQVDGDYECMGNKLTTINGSPEAVGGFFDCSINLLSDLNGGPRYVGTWYDCGNNRLKSTIGAPDEINGDFDCTKNPDLKIVDGSPRLIHGNLAFEGEVGHNTIVKGKIKSMR